MCDKHLLNECIDTEESSINKIAHKVGVDSALIKRTISKSLTIVINTVDYKVTNTVRSSSNFVDRIMNKYASESAE